jgi:hypothetical protein
VEFESDDEEGEEEVYEGGKIILLGRERVCLRTGEGERNWENGTSVLFVELAVLPKCLEGEGDLAIVVGLFSILHTRINNQ